MQIKQQLLFANPTPNPLTATSLLSDSVHHFTLPPQASTEDIDHSVILPPCIYKVKTSHIRSKWKWCEGYSAIKSVKQDLTVQTRPIWKVRTSHQSYTRTL
ncbi:hypothetical protein ACTXT7_014086 [Hymenolepis weldensis]